MENHYLTNNGIWITDPSNSFMFDKKDKYLNGYILVCPKSKKFQEYLMYRGKWMNGFSIISDLNFDDEDVNTENIYIHSIPDKIHYKLNILGISIIDYLADFGFQNIYFIDNNYTKIEKVLTHRNFKEI